MQTWQTTLHKSLIKKHIMFDVWFLKLFPGYKTVGVTDLHKGAYTHN